MQLLMMDQNRSGKINLRWDGRKREFRAVIVSSSGLTVDSGLMPAIKDVDSLF
jgi:hypothetical protein